MATVRAGQLASDPAREAATTGAVSAAPSAPGAGDMVWRIATAHTALAEQLAELRNVRGVLPPGFDDTYWRLDALISELIGWRSWAEEYASGEGEGASMV